MQFIDYTLLPSSAVTSVSTGSIQDPNSSELILVKGQRRIEIVVPQVVMSDENAENIEEDENNENNSEVSSENENLDIEISDEIVVENPPKRQSKMIDIEADDK